MEGTEVNDIFSFDGESVDVEQWPAFEEKEIISGNPAHRGRVLYRDPEKRVSYGIWECPPGVIDVDYGPMAEHNQCVKGRATVTNIDTGTKIEMTPGVRAVFPVGSHVRWEIHEEFRKVYTAYEAEWDEERYY
jgi:uncharacterized protein